MNHYEVLGVSKNSEMEVIDAAFRALMKKYHPDRGGNEERARQINDAYRVLRNHERRRAYDRDLEQDILRATVAGARSTKDDQSASPIRRGRSSTSFCKTCGNVLLGPGVQCPDCAGNRKLRRKVSGKPGEPSWLIIAALGTSLLLLIAFAPWVLDRLADTQPDTKTVNVSDLIDGEEGPRKPEKWVEIENDGPNHVFLDMNSVQFNSPDASFWLRVSARRNDDGTSTLVQVTFDCEGRQFRLGMKHSYQADGKLISSDPPDDRYNWAAPGTTMDAATRPICARMGFSERAKARRLAVEPIPPAVDEESEDLPAASAMEDVSN